MLKTRLISAILVMTIAASTLAAPNDPTSAAPPVQANNSSDVVKFLFQAVLAVAFLKAMLSDSSSGPSSSDSDIWRYRQHEPDYSGAQGARPDTSAGCAWGDRSFGTCH